MRDALGAAEGFCADLAGALSPGAQVTIVPGNHDHHLLEPWRERRARKGPPEPLGLQSAVDWCAGEPLASIARQLSPVQPEVFYPGVWLRPDMYAMHGHYSDRHATVPMLERLGAGVMAKIVREAAAGPRRAEDYEATLAPLYAWMYAIAQIGDEPSSAARPHSASAQAWRALSGRRGRLSLRRRLLALGFPVAIAALNRAGIGPLRADLSSVALRRGRLSAIGEVLDRLQVDAGYVIFGHTHRAGPLPGDDQSEWRTAAGAQLLNTGCWMHEAAFLGAEPASSPYRAGFCVLIETEQAPRLINLLDPARS